MTPVDQRILASTTRDDGHNGLGMAGDCVRAAVASLLDLDYHQVPHFCNYPTALHVNDGETDDPLTEEHGGLWWRRLRRWLRDEHRLDAQIYEWEQPDNKTGRLELRYISSDEPWSGHVLLGGRSPRGDFAHQVVGYYGWTDAGLYVRLEHDPHPSRAGLRTIEDVTILVNPYAPAPPTEAEELAAVTA